MGDTDVIAPPRVVAAAGFLSLLGDFLHCGNCGCSRDTGELGEIVVTAQRRSERSRVPMSIQASARKVSINLVCARSMTSIVYRRVTFIRNGMSSSGNYNDEDSDISIRGIDPRGHGNHGDLCR